MICAALWPDPADPLCPPAFRQAAVVAMKEFSLRVNPKKITIEESKLKRTLSDESRYRWEAIAEGTLPLDPNEPIDMSNLRMALLDFVADFANWDNSTVPAYLETSRILTQAAHEALGGTPGTRPLVVDPFCGGGSIPLEALRVGADAFASDLNPVPVLLNKVVLEYIPKYGQQLADEVRKWGAWIKREAEKELIEFYPKDPDGANPIAYLWARTIRCEGPACGAEVPLIRSLWLAKKASRSVAIQLIPNPAEKRVDFQIIVKEHDGWVDQTQPNVKTLNPSFDGTVKRGSATCICCGYTTPVTSVRSQLKLRKGGAHDARLYVVVTMRVGEQGRRYRPPTDVDLDAVRRTIDELDRRKKESCTSPDGSGLSLVPDELISPNELRRISIPLYGMACWGDLFAPRQALALTTLSRLVRESRNQLRLDHEPMLADAVGTCLGLVVGRQSDFQSSLVTWTAGGEFAGHTFVRQAIGMVWDFCETNLWADASGNWDGATDWVARVIAQEANAYSSEGHVEQASATHHPLPDDTASAVVTDPPYYDAVPYAYLSDFFFVWQRRILNDTHPNLFHEDSVPKDEEIVVDRPHQLSKSNKGIAFYECELQKAFAEGRRVLRPDGICTIVFASKTTSSWEAILKAVIDAGWIITASWPIDTEREARIAAQGQARLASSVHLVCRPRENVNGTITESIGEWRDVLGELPKRIHEWMPRLATEGVVGADAIFACLGPSLEIYSRFNHVEKANGEIATLHEYLEHVWAAVSTEALSLIFKDANAVGLEPDARLTAMWLWTLGGASRNGNERTIIDEDQESNLDDEDHNASTATGKSKLSGGFLLEYDAARKIAQGLGVHLEQSESLVEVKGDKARLLPVSERTQYLFGKDAKGSEAIGNGKKKVKQKMLFDQLDDVDAAESGWADLKGPEAGKTVLDRVHQSMILFAANRSEMLKRFLVDDGVGKDARFWKLADNLNKLYPTGTDERRWIEGVLARKKGLSL